ncbi:MAG TPA: HAMP domain-containing protein [Verrucomicrobiae bacterium]|nr:HAMP domain-containing protein [Verrucomicrobiae bacterium]
MKSLRWRLTCWFAASLLGVLAVMAISAHWHLDSELRQEKWERTRPEHPDWILHGSFTDQEVHDILKELLQVWLLIGTPAIVLAVIAAYLLARQSLRPVRQVNRQLAAMGPGTLSRRITAPATDPEFRELVQHLNLLLGRLENSFGQLQDYTTQVAHELRTPLQLMRLRLENEAAGLKPELAEELQEELARLSSYVESALTIARAEHGRLELHPEDLPLKEFLTDLIEPFALLAATSGRRLFWSCPDAVEIRSDRNALKQVLFSLLNNALQHGAGNVLLRARLRGNHVVVLIGNERPTTMPAAGRGLGIGLRLARALIQQMPGAGVAIRQGKLFCVRLKLPRPAGDAVNREGSSSPKRQFGPVFASRVNPGPVSIE